MTETIKGAGSVLSQDEAKAVGVFTKNRKVLIAAAIAVAVGWLLIEIF